MHYRNRRAVLLLVVVFAVLTALVLTLTNQNVNLGGVAVVNASEVAVENPPVEATPQESAQQSEPAGETVEQVQVPTDISPTDVPPTDIPATLPEPTLIPTEIPTDIPAEVTETPVPAAEETEIPSDVAETTPEAIPEPEVATEITPEATSELEVTEEVTPEATPELSQYDVAITCTETGTAFSVTDLGESMTEPEAYLLDGIEVGEIALAAGETTTIEAGYGTPQLAIGGTIFQSDTPCQRPPELAVTTECALDTGVTFTLTNTGEAMETAESYTITQAETESTGTFQLGEGESIDIPAGFGSPAFTAGELTALVDPACPPPSHIQGRIWQDMNADSLYTEDELGLAGIVIQLVNADGFPVATTTLEDGHYDFFPVGQGSYNVQISQDTLPTAVENSADPDGTPDSITALEVVSGENYTRDFGYAPVATASISGMVWLEMGNFGGLDAGETGLNGVRAQLIDATGTVIGEYLISADGKYRFEGVVAGDYVVRLVAETLPQPYGVTFNQDSNYDLDTAVSVEPGQVVADVNFGIVGTF